MATFTNTWDESIPLNASLTGLSEAGKIDALIRQMKLDVRERILKFMPVGMVIKWPGHVVPYGFKECNGESLLRAMYPDLFSVIGTVHGTSDSTHFNLPDIRGYFLRGWNNSRATGLYDPNTASRLKTTKTGATMSDGDHVGTTQIDENKAHRHTYGYGYLSHSSYGIMPAHPDPSISSGNYGDENRPANIYFKYIIRVDNQIPAVTDEDDDEYYSYVRTWDEGSPVSSDYMGRMALEIRKLRVDVQELLDNFYRPGMVIYWPSASSPDGYLELNGQAVDRTTYADLFNEIGDTYGPGDGETTFNVPDVRGLFIRSHDNGAGVDSLASSRTGGNNVGSTQGDGLKVHNHTYDGVKSGMSRSSGSISGNIGISRSNNNLDNSPPRTVDAHPKNIYLMACIKAKRCL